MKLWFLLPALALVGLVAGSVAASDGDWLEPNTDRMGSDYRDFDLPYGPGSDAGLKQCMVTCEQEDQCVAFTYVRAGVQGPNPRCWLKNSVPDAAPADCCISWVKGGTPGYNNRPHAAPARSIPLQTGIDLNGSDYRDFEMAPDATPEMCAQECQGDAQCRAFTYVRAGVQGAGPHCWLKNTVPQAYDNADCVSGVK